MILNRTVMHSSVIGEGKPLILIHGLFGMGANLAMVAKALAEHYRVYSVDLRNHGLSFRASSMTFNEMAEDVCDFMDSEGIESTAVLGHSLGGKVAMQLALNYFSRVEQLIVADISPIAYSGHHDSVFDGLQAIDVNTIPSRREAEHVLQQYVDDAGVRQFLLKNLYRTEHKVFDWRMNVDALFHCYTQICGAVTADQPFDGPVMFIKGENSQYILPEHRDAITQLFKNVSFKMIQNTGHWLHAEKTVAFNNIVQKFLSSNSK